MALHLPLKASKGIAYPAGLYSGLGWGLDAVLMSVAMGMAPFVHHPKLLIGGALLASALHETLAALWIVLLGTARGDIRSLPRLIRTRDARFCMLAALMGGPFAMSFYLMAIAQSGSALAATVTSSYPRAWDNTRYLRAHGAGASTGMGRTADLRGRHCGH